MVSVVYDGVPGAGTVEYFANGQSAGVATAVGQQNYGYLGSLNNINDLAVLRIEEVSLNGGTIVAATDEAVQAIVQPGDVTGNGQVDAQDAYELEVFLVFDHHGFRAYSNLDPVIVADLNGDGHVGLHDLAFLQHTLDSDGDMFEGEMHFVASGRSTSTARPLASDLPELLHDEFSEDMIDGFFADALAAKELLLND